MKNHTEIVDKKIRKNIAQPELTILKNLPLPLAVRNGQKEWIMISDNMLAHPHSQTSIQIQNIENEKARFLELDREYLRIFSPSENSLAIIFTDEIRIYQFCKPDPIDHKKTHIFSLAKEEGDRIQNIKMSPDRNFLFVYLAQNNNSNQRIDVIDIAENKILHSDFTFETDYGHDFFILNSGKLAILDHQNGILLYDVNLHNTNSSLLTKVDTNKPLLNNESINSVIDCPKDIIACMHNAYSLSPNLILWKMDNQLELEKLLIFKHVNPFVEPSIYKDELYFYNKSKELMKINFKTLDSVSLGVVEGLSTLQINPEGKFMVSYHNGVTIYQIN